MPRTRTVIYDRYSLIVIGHLICQCSCSSVDSPWRSEEQDKVFVPQDVCVLPLQCHSQRDGCWDRPVHLLHPRLGRAVPLGFLNLHLDAHTVPDPHPPILRQLVQDQLQATRERLFQGILLCGRCSLSLFPSPGQPMEGKETPPAGVWEGLDQAGEQGTS